MTIIIGILTVIINIWVPHKNLLIQFYTIYLESPKYYISFYNNKIYVATYFISDINVKKYSFVNAE